MALDPDEQAKLKSANEFYEAIVAAEHGASAEHLLPAKIVDVTNPEQSFPRFGKTW